jgi:hypothetical protein
MSKRIIDKFNYTQVAGTRLSTELAFSMAYNGLQMAGLRHKCDIDLSIKSFRLKLSVDWLIGEKYFSRVMTLNREEHRNSQLVFGYLAV